MITQKYRFEKSAFTSSTTTADSHSIFTHHIRFLSSPSFFLEIEIDLSISAPLYAFIIRFGSRIGKQILERAVLLACFFRELSLLSEAFTVKLPHCLVGRNGSLQPVAVAGVLEEDLGFSCSKREAPEKLFLSAAS